MMVFWGAKLVYLAMPKTGSTALQEAYGARAAMILRHPQGMKHAQLFRYQRFILPFLEAQGGYDFETCAAIREPLDWLGSWYRYRHRDALAGRPNSTRGLSFAQFVEAYLSDMQPPYARVGRQARFCAARQGLPGLDYLFRYEAPDAFEGFLVSRLGESRRIARRNVSPQMALHLPAPLRQRAQAALSEEYALWEGALH